MHTLAIRVLVICWLATITTGCRPDPSPLGAGGSQRVTLALNWFPEAEHGGFYAASVHGYFADEDLEVEILPGGPGAPVIQQVATGRVDFAIANADQVLLGRDQQAPVACVMAAIQNSPRCIMVHKKSGIRRLQDLNDLTLSLGVGKPFAKFLLKHLGDAELDIIPYQGNVTMFLQREDFAQQAYVFSEPFVARKMGGDPHCLMISELGFNPYTSVLIANDTFIESEAETVRKMVRACVRGWKKYLEDPDETNRLIHSLNPEMDIDILAFGASSLKQLCDAEAPLGQMTETRWRQLADQLVEVDLLDSNEAWKGAFHLEFVAPVSAGEEPGPF